jgi:hypothetical protein
MGQTLYQSGAGEFREQERPLCIYTQGGIDAMATQSRARQAIALHGRFEEEAIALRAPRSFASERLEWQTIGRYQTLEHLAADLSSITDDMKPGQVREVVLNQLDRLAEAKVTWLVSHIRMRGRTGINQLGEWKAEGAIAQIDAVVPHLYRLLATRGNPTPRTHGRYFQVFRRLAPDGVDDLQRIATRWAWARERWYGEVAILGYDDAPVLPDQLSQGSRGPVGRNGGARVVWSPDGAEVGQMCQGDVIVSLLSGASWLVGENGLSVLGDGALELPTTRLEVDAARAGAADDQAGELARFVQRYKLELRIEAGPLPSTLMLSDPYFASLRERYQDLPPDRDLWRLTLLALGAGGQSLIAGPELPLTWESNQLPTLAEILGVLQGMIGSVWDGALGRCSLEVWKESGLEFDSPEADACAFESQCGGTWRVRAFLGEEGFEELRAIPF